MKEITPKTPKSPKTLEKNILVTSDFLFVSTMLCNHYKYQVLNRNKVLSSNYELNEIKGSVLTLTR